MLFCKDCKNFYDLQNSINDEFGVCIKKNMRVSKKTGICKGDFVEGINNTKLGREKFEAERKNR